MKSAWKIITCLLLTVSVCHGEGITRKINHKTEARYDGGYNLTLGGTIQSLMPITAEGFFPKSPINYKIILKGKGKEWSYRNQPGYFYSFPEDIDAKPQSWDVGYAWVDKNRETIYLNFYWVKSPDSLTESEINGAYKVKP
ncbi:hypothetical protein [Geomobilimonas luticola]|uniref:Uncharacterized protein n=1 Tax=Geomobilimonas luticola TaxID=1114878 RepID=A0ABS5SBG9_9BACT|nr:hypothetical protein [Geomobilimonas luticola]MBT0652714.1 hypothetical protein [Geomobilimonas luticola]